MGRIFMHWKKWVQWTNIVCKIKNVIDLPNWTHGAIKTITDYLLWQYDK